MAVKSAPADTATRLAYQFIILMGVVSLCGDITYEGARSITGPFLATLGATAAVVGLVAGLGEFLGYALRLVSGYFADRTRAYWPLTFLGYGLMLAIPLLALAGNWPLAAVFIVAERMGKAVRSPARDAILSHATKQVGRGWGFGLHEAMDQIGAVTGPLVFTLVFLLRGGYRQGFALLVIPALLCLVVLAVAQRRVPNPERFERAAGAAADGPAKLSGVFWAYTLFIFLSVAGFANFQLISFHLKAQAILTDAMIPLLYALAMGVDAVVALVIGKAYDRFGMPVLGVVPVLTAVIPFFAFGLGVSTIVVSVVLWGAVMGIHETIMRAAIADLTPIARRGLAYGIFNTAYGLAWLVGGLVLGELYDHARMYIPVVVVVLELAAVPVWLWFSRKSAKPATA